MAKALGMPPAAEMVAEKDFYLDEFRGRSVMIAVAPTAVDGRSDLAPLALAVGELVRNGTRVLLWWPLPRLGAERRLLAALARARAVSRARGPLRRPPPLMRMGEVAAGAPLRGRLWGHLRHGRLCILSGGDPEFPGGARDLARSLRVAKLILIDAEGGLAPGAQRLSFVDENQLETLLREGQAEWLGLGHRRALLEAVHEALRGGVASVNLCTLVEVGSELFTYEGCGTLFTQGDYCRVGRLGLDDFAQAERLLERGQREGLLKLRTTEEVEDVLAAGYGAMIGGRHLAGVAGLLTAPYEAERAGEIVGLYTITRFKGEGIGERLVGHILSEAAWLGLDYVFACALDARAQQFFARMGFARVRTTEVPAAKWRGYDPRRRARLRVYRQPVPASALPPRTP
jgi:amino-acid N-acetyltransferase